MNGAPRILVADDSADGRELIIETLKSQPWQVVAVADGRSVIESVASQAPDLILLDFQMPGMDGFEVCRQLRRDRHNQLLPVLMLSGYSDLSHRVAALTAGADDFLRKPIERTELIARVRSLLRMKSMHDQLEDTRQVILTLAKAIEAKDMHTHEHSERVAKNSSALATRIRMTADRVDQIRTGALIHDIGKISVPDDILNKRGPLTDEEFDLVKRHTVVGADIVAPLLAQPDVMAIVRHHHERYDGAGYPDALAREAIPQSARIVAICDAFDAMVSNRPYRPAMALGEAAALLAAGRNRQWDGYLVDLFIDRFVRPHTELQLIAV